MTVTQVDVGKLKACGQAPANGILYVSKSGAGGGVRLANGTELPSQGLTVVSENPVYIQGDYNTVNKVPAAVLGDAVTVLSNNWESMNYDTKGDIATSSRQAAETTVNAAFAMGPISTITARSSPCGTASKPLRHGGAAGTMGITTTCPRSGTGPTIPSLTQILRRGHRWGSSRPGGSGPQADSDDRRQQLSAVSNQVSAVWISSCGLRVVSASVYPC
jgi:hypothetical protein